MLFKEVSPKVSNAAAMQLHAALDPLFVNLPGYAASPIQFGPGLEPSCSSHREADEENENGMLRAVCPAPPDWKRRSVWSWVACG